MPSSHLYKTKSKGVFGADVGFKMWGTFTLSAPLFVQTPFVSVPLCVRPSLSLSPFVSVPLCVHHSFVSVHPSCPFTLIITLARVPSSRRQARFKPVGFKKCGLDPELTVHFVNTLSQVSSPPTRIQLRGRKSRSPLPSPAKIRVCTSSCARRTPGSATKCSPRMWVSVGTGRAAPSPKWEVPPRHARQTWSFSAILAFVNKSWNKLRISFPPQHKC